ncbi:MAG: DUF4349 domain-containing protein [Phycisphaerae bacterium]
MHRIVMGLALPAMLAGGCGNAGYAMDSESLMLSRTDETQYQRSAGPASAAAEMTTEDDRSEAGELNFNVRITRKMVYMGRFVLLVPEVRSAQDRIRRLAVDMDGYLQSMDSEEVIIRVPAARFVDASNALKDIGTVAQRRVTAEDVTDKHYDIETRIANHEAMAKRLRDLLNKAEKMKDALEIERELAQVLMEMERLKGQLKLLDSMVAYATLAIDLKGTVEYSPPTLNVDLPIAWLKSMGLQDLLRFNGRAILK